MINNNKKFLRKAFKEKRSKINLSQYQYLCKCIYNNLIKLEIWDKDFFHIYFLWNQQDDHDLSFVC